MNSEDKEFRSGIGTYAYGYITKVVHNGVNRDGQTFKKFYVNPMKRKPKELHYIIENKDVVFKSKPFIKERKIVGFKQKIIIIISDLNRKML